MALLLAVILVACSPAVPTPLTSAPGPTPTITVPADLPVVVTIAGPVRAPEPDVLYETIAIFAAANPDVWVEIANVRGDSDQRRDRIAAALEQGDAGVDVYVVDDTWLAEFAASGWLLPLDDYVEAGGLDMGGFPSGAVEAATIDSKLVGLPWIGTGQSLAISAFSQAPGQAFRLIAFLAGYEQ